MATLALLRLGAMTGDNDLRQKAEQSLKLYSAALKRAPAAFPQMLNALDFFEASPYEIVVVGSPEERKKMLAAVHQRFLPNKVVLAGDPATAQQNLVDVLPLFEGKLGGGEGPRAYVCRDFVCSPAVGDERELVDLLK